MKSMLKLLMMVALFAGSLNWSMPASACSCVQPPGIAEELESSDAVFSGKVISVEEKQPSLFEPSKTAVFQVDTIWKGIEQSQVKITTGLGGGDCGLNFSIGKEYLVYATESDNYGEQSLSTIICDRTATLTQAQGDVAVLGEGQAPTEEVDLLSRNGWLLPVIGFIVLAIIGFIVYRRRKKIK